MKIHHIGYLVKSIEKSMPEFIKLGYEKETEIVYDDFRKINICFIKNENYRIEFVEPAKECDFLQSLSKKIGVGTYHVCYESTDFDNDIKNLTENGYIVVQEKAEAIAINKKMLFFLYSRNTGLLEIVES